MEVPLKQTIKIEYEDGTYGSRSMNSQKIQEVMPFTITKFVTPVTEVSLLKKLIMAPNIAEIHQPEAFTKLSNLEHLVFPKNLTALSDRVCEFN